MELTTLICRLLSSLLLILSFSSICSSFPTPSPSIYGLVKRKDPTISIDRVLRVLEGNTPQVDWAKVLIYPEDREGKAQKIVNDILDEQTDFTDWRRILRLPAVRHTLGVNPAKAANLFDADFKTTFRLGVVLSIKRAWVVRGLEGRYESEWHDTQLPTLQKRIEAGELSTLYHLANDVSDINAKGAVRATEDAHSNLKPVNGRAYQASPDPETTKPPRSSVKVNANLWLHGNRYWSAGQYYVMSPAKKLIPSDPPTADSNNMRVDTPNLRTGWYKTTHFSNQAYTQLDEEAFYNAENDVMWMPIGDVSEGKDIWVPVSLPSFDRFARCKRAGGGSCSNAVLQDMEPVEDPTTGPRALKPGDKGWAEAYAKAMDEMMKRISTLRANARTAGNTATEGEDDGAAKKPAKRPAAGTPAPPEMPHIEDTGKEPKARPGTPRAPGMHNQPAHVQPVKAPPMLAVHD